MKEHSRLLSQYVDLGLQYYIAARFCAAHGAAFAPVLGNLFHHAIEMCLKGALCKNVGEQVRRKLGHDLKKLWKRFKKENADAALNKFNHIISELHKFESIRYPENIVVLGMECTVSFVRGEIVSDGSEPRYNLIIEDIDALMAAILNFGSINARYFTHKFRGDALKALQHQNNENLW
jgi:hypothetical protein